MTQEDKLLLLKDLCARLPYGVQCHIKHIHHLSGWIDEGDVILTGFRQDEFTKETELLFRKPGGNPKIVFPIDSIKPYLRPVSSMTKEELDKLNEIISKEDHDGYFFVQEEPYYYGLQLQTSDIGCVTGAGLSKAFDYLNSIHVDYRGLIPNLALEAPEGMYE